MATWLMFRYIRSTIQHYSLTLSVAPLFSLSPYLIFTTCTMADYSDEDHEGYIPWWDCTPTGSSSSTGDSSDEIETEREVYSSDKELFYDYEYAYEEAMEHYLNDYSFFFDANDKDEDEDNDSSSDDDDDDDDDDDGTEQPSKRGRRQ